MTYTLHITSWSERGFDATHYYGSLRYDPQEPGVGVQRIDLEHRVHVSDGRYYDSLLHRGEKTFWTGRFVSKELVRVAARRWMFANAKPTDLLVVEK